MYYVFNKRCFKCHFLLPAIFLAVQSGWSQVQVYSPEQMLTIEAGSDTTLYFGFAEGDEVILKVEEINGRKIQEVTVSEYPDNEKLAVEAVSQLSDARIKVYRNAVYAIHLSNNAASRKRACKIDIQRIPASKETADFVTAVKWLEVVDTLSNTTVADMEGPMHGTDSIFKSVVVLVDTSVIVLATDPQTTNAVRIAFQIPKKTYSFDRFKLERTIEPSACVYSIDVGEAGEAWYAEANDIASRRKKPLLLLDPDTRHIESGQYEAMILKGLTYDYAFPSAQNLDSIRYSIDRLCVHSNKFEKTGGTVSGYLGTSIASNCCIYLENRYYARPLEVHVRVIAILLVKYKGKGPPPQEIETLSSEQYRKIIKRRIPVLVEG